MKLNFKKIVLFFCLTFFGASHMANAIPAYPGLIKLTLNDGSQISVRNYGDEHFHYTITSDGYTILQKEDGLFYYAVLGNDGLLAASEVRANDPAKRNSAEISFLKTVNPGIISQLSRMEGEARARIANATRIERLEARRSVNNNAVLTDVKEEKALVLLVNFKDVSFTTVANPKQAITNLLNQEGYSVNQAVGSAKDYFKFNSDGRYEITFDVEGPFDLPQNRTYYGGNVGGEDKNPRQMVVDACRLAAAAGVDFSKYAVNGEVPNLIIIYAGHGEADSGMEDTIWPHEWQLANMSLTLNGVRINTYACSQEIWAATGVLTGIGVICHEFGHVLGLPDFYDTDYENNGTCFGLSYTSFMDAGSYLFDGNVPPAFNAVERNLVGWLEYTDISSEGEVILNPVYDNVAYRLKTDMTDEYFIFEYRNGTHNGWDRFLSTGDNSLGVRAGEGMFVYHFDRSNNKIVNLSAKQLWGQNMVNAYKAHECMRLITSDTSVKGEDKIIDIQKLVYPGSKKITELKQTTSPALKPWSNSALAFGLSNITLNTGQNVTFRVVNLREGLLIKNLNAEPSQTTIAVTIGADEEGTWTVKYYKTGEETSAKTIEVAGNRFNIGALKPDTSYEIIVTDKINTSNTKTISSTTVAATSGIPRINMENEYSLKNSSVILFDVINISSNFESVKWAVGKNGVATDTAYKAMTPGSYDIKCVIRNSDGSQETLIKRIVVKE